MQASPDCLKFDGIDYNSIEIAFLGKENSNDCKRLHTLLLWIFGRPVFPVGMTVAYSWGS
jgi:hypothetical protein